MSAQPWRRSYTACGAAPASGRRCEAGSWLKVNLAKPRTSAARVRLMVLYLPTDCHGKYLVSMICKRVSRLMCMTSFITTSSLLLLQLLLVPCRRHAHHTRAGASGQGA
jgi:hypothetical protein